MTEQAQWSGPPRFLPPGRPTVRDDGSRQFSGLSYALVSGYRPLQLDVWAVSYTHLTLPTN